VIQEVIGAMENKRPGNLRGQTVGSGSKQGQGGRGGGEKTEGGQKGNESPSLQKSSRGYPFDENERKI